MKYQICQFFIETPNVLIKIVETVSITDEQSIIFTKVSIVKRNERD